MSTPCYYCELDRQHACQVCVHGEADAEDLRELIRRAAAPVSEQSICASCKAIGTAYKIGKDACEQDGKDALTDMEGRKDAAYYERNQVVAALAKCFPSGTARTAIEGWSEDWHGCVYIDLPTGQVSWHYHDTHSHLFDGLPPYQGRWDGHDTPEKYRRVAALDDNARDAERYRVLRDPAYQRMYDDPCVTDDSFNTFFEEDLDKAVDALKARRDAAMAQQPGKDGA